MFKYFCKICKIEKKLEKATLEIFEGTVRTKEAKCKCGNYMQEIAKEFGGFPTLIRTEPTLKKN
tara:strand:+ start:78 stop:269 length:192 start_codon:yes stop_codon:yes gene_type:complete